MALVTELGSPVNFASFTRTAGQEFNAGPFEQKNIFDLGLSPPHFSKLMSYLYKTSYLPFMWDHFDDRVKAIPMRTHNWREAKELLTGGLVVDKVSGDANTLVIRTKGYEDQQKEWWLPGTEIVSALTNRHFNIISTGGTDKLDLTIKPYDGVAILYSGGESVDFPDGTRFGEIAIDRNSKGDLVTGRQTDFINYGNIMSAINGGCTIKKDAWMDRILWSFDESGKPTHYVLKLEHDELIRMYHQSNNKLLHGQMNKNAAIESESGAGLYQQIHPDCNRPYTTLTAEVLRKGLKDWRQLNVNNPPEMVVGWCGTESYDDVQRICEGMQPFMWNKTSGFQKIDKDLAVGQEYKFFYWAGIMIAFKYEPGLDAKNVQAAVSPVNDRVSNFSHDILLMDMGMKGGQQPGTTGGEYKIGVYCPMDPKTGGKDFMQTMTKPGSIDGNGSPINGVVTSFADEVQRQWVNRFMICVEEKYAVFNFNRRT